MNDLLHALESIRLIVTHVDIANRGLDFGAYAIGKAIVSDLRHTFEDVPGLGSTPAKLKRLDNLFDVLVGAERTGSATPLVIAWSKNVIEHVIEDIECECVAADTGSDQENSSYRMVLRDGPELAKLS